MYRKKRGETAYTIMETDDEIPRSIAELLTRNDDILDVRIIRSDAAEAQHAGAEATCADPEQAQAVFEQLDYQNAAAMLAACEKQHMNLAQAMYAREDALCAVQGRDAAATRRYLQHALDVMRRSATRPIEAPVSSMGGLIGGEAHLLAALEQTDTAPVSGLLARACTYAAAVLETNASMGCIVAAPTAGASGVLPAVLLACQEERGYTDDELVDALACAAAIGYIATRNATVAGAQGGCQAEVGTASAMAAAACAQLSGATPAQCFAAASNALCGMMGLVCDPIAGLVEAPCQKRNVHGAANALVSAHMACAGIQNIVNFDETLEAARRVGESLPHELRETALGGLAATPSACAWCETYRTTRHAAAFGRDGAGI